MMNRSNSGRVDQCHMVGRGKAKNVSRGRKVWSWHGEQDKQSKQQLPTSGPAFGADIFSRGERIQ